MTLINPYNFVPLKGEGSVRSSEYPGRHLLLKESYSGALVCTLKAESPLVSLDHRCLATYTLLDRDGTPLKNNKGEKYKDIDVFKFLRNAARKPILQGTSLKGMVRSVFEAMTDSCMVLANTTGYQGIGSYDANECNALEWLCPACRLFGAIKGNLVSCQGRVIFTDAVLTGGEIIQKRLYLKELSRPKPAFSSTYGKSLDPGGPIAGRKFYYHHGNSPEFDVKEHNSNDRSIAIEEHASVGSEFSFQVNFDNLREEELSFLLLAIELPEGLGHKIGLGKAIGLGSCTIRIHRQESLVTKGDCRYRGLEEGESLDLDKLKADRTILAEGLIEVLRLNKPSDGEIRYPSGVNYPNEPIDSLGVFGGKSKRGGRPAWPMAAATSAPQKPAPEVKQDQEAAWLKEIYEDKLLFVNEQGTELVRPRNAYQGKPDLLEVGEWFILWGTNASRRA